MFFANWPKRKRPLSTSDPCPGRSGSGPFFSVNVRDIFVVSSIFVAVVQTVRDETKSSFILKMVLQITKYENQSRWCLMWAVIMTSSVSIWLTCTLKEFMNVRKRERERWLCGNMSMWDNDQKESAIVKYWRSSLHHRHLSLSHAFLEFFHAIKENLTPNPFCSSLVSSQPRYISRNAIFFPKPPSSAFLHTERSHARQIISRIEDVSEPLCCIVLLLLKTSRETEKSSNPDSWCC